eukprot:136902-Chlamydomonas_euryale.AAC.2
MCEDGHLLNERLNGHPGGKRGGGGRAQWAVIELFAAGGRLQAAQIGCWLDLAVHAGGRCYWLDPAVCEGGWYGTLLPESGAQGSPRCLPCRRLVAGWKGVHGRSVWAVADGGGSGRFPGGGPAAGDCCRRLLVVVLLEVCVGDLLPVVATGGTRVSPKQQAGSARASSRRGLHAQAAGGSLRAQAAGGVCTRKQQAGVCARKATAEWLDPLALTEATTRDWPRPAYCICLLYLHT